MNLTCEQFQICWEKHILGMEKKKNQNLTIRPGCPNSELKSKIRGLVERGGGGVSVAFTPSFFLPNPPQLSPFVLKSERNL